MVISLDFELCWGMHDRLGTDFAAYRENLEGVREVVPALLRLFSDRKVRATWACVGALGCSGWEEYFRRAPSPPQYRDARHGVNPRYAELDPDGHLHFAPDLLQLVKATPGQQLGTHTFSHILVQEPGVTAQDVAVDLEAACKLWTERFGGPPRSLVFPRNQDAFLDVIVASTVRVWRGPERAWYYSGNSSPIRRALRLAHSFNPLVRHASTLQLDSPLAMTRASLFLRANLPGAAWALQVAGIRRELGQVGPGEVYHLWWHPHNLGKGVKARLGRVGQVLDLVAERCEQGVIVSRSMEDLVERS